MKTNNIAWLSLAVGLAAFVIPFVLDVRNPYKETGLRLIEVGALLAIAIAAAFLTRDAKRSPLAFVPLGLAGGAATVVGVIVRPHADDAYVHPLICVGLVLATMGIWLLGTDRRHWKSMTGFGVLLALVAAIMVRSAYS